MLKVHGLGKQFGGLAALRDVGFDVPAGQIRAVIGPNGAGKTTLFHLVTGVLAPSNGTVTIDGRRVDGLAASEIARLGVARTFQQPQVMRTQTVLQNVMLGGDRRGVSGLVACGFATGRATREETRQADVARTHLAFTGLSAFADRVASELSLGRQRYVELARALNADPRLLLLDEPAAGLDDTETADLAQLILRIRDRGITVVLIEHHMKFVMGIADRIVVLNFGEAIADGTPAEVRGSKSVIDAYLGIDDDA